MSIVSRILSLFTGGPSGAAQAPASDPQLYKDCMIHAAPVAEGSQYRLAGRIERQVDGRLLERSFIRADVFSSRDDAVEGTFRKAQQIIDQNGPSLFGDGAEKRNV